MKSETPPPIAAEFRLLGASQDFIATGIRAEVEPGGADSMAARVSAFFSRREAGPDRIVGAIPFERDADDFLYQPDAVIVRARADVEPAAGPHEPAQACDVAAIPSATAYGKAVTGALAAMEASRGKAEPLRKVVLSRSLSVTAKAPTDPRILLAHLSEDSSATAFVSPLQLRGASRPVLVGATPELLVSRQGRIVVSHPLAGSARRHADPGLDRQSAGWLERSDKNRREHREVVDAVMDALAPYCDELSAPEGTTLRSTATMWHLGTRIVGRLKDDATSAAELAAALHPTPAVCGMPRLPAARLIRQLEGYDRGFYAGAVGWTDARGDGEWHVALRCAEVDANLVRLYAGAGIVPGSEPAAEIDETSAKFLAMLTALGIDENGNPLVEKAA